MYTMNQLTIIGFTGNDAEAHYTPNGTLVVTISVATKESWKDADGNWQTRTDWHRVLSFGKQAEFTRTLTKWSYVMVQGALRTREYERVGAKHRTVELRADTIGKLDRAERRIEVEGDPDAGVARMTFRSGHLQAGPDDGRSSRLALLLQPVRLSQLVSTSLRSGCVCVHTLGGKDSRRSARRYR